MAKKKKAPRKQGNPYICVNAQMDPKVLKSLKELVKPGMTLQKFVGDTLTRAEAELKKGTR